MSDNQKTIGNIPNGEFAEKVSKAIDKGRKKAKEKIEQVKADDEYTAKDAPIVDRPLVDEYDDAFLLDEIRRIYRQYLMAEYKRNQRRDAVKDVKKFLMMAGALFLGVFFSMLICSLIF